MSGLENTDFEAVQELLELVGIGYSVTPLEATHTFDVFCGDECVSGPGECDGHYDTRMLRGLSFTNRKGEVRQIREVNDEGAVILVKIP